MALLSLPSLLLLCILASQTHANVEITAPALGSSYIGGGQIEIAWIDNGTFPTLADLTTYTLSLCAGGNDVGMFECSLATLVLDASFSWGSDFSATTPSPAGPDASMAYFIRMISVADTGAASTIYTPRFSLTGMTGEFDTTIISGLATISDPMLAGSPAGGFDDTAGPFAVPYNLQSGIMRYAPMQQVPGTAIMAKTARPLWPTSAASIATTWVSQPTILTTITQSGTWSVKSRENTAAPATNPTNDAMAKWLARWKD